VRRERESWAEHWAKLSSASGRRKLIPISKAVESTSDAIGMADMSRKVIYLNQAFINLYGYTADKLNTAGGPLCMPVQLQRSL